MGGGPSGEGYVPFSDWGELQENRRIVLAMRATEALARIWGFLMSTGGKCGGRRVVQISRLVHA